MLEYQVQMNLHQYDQYDIIRESEERIIRDTRVLHEIEMVKVRQRNDVVAGEIFARKNVPIKCDIH